MNTSIRERALLLAGRVPRYVNVGERDPQQQVRVALHGLGEAIDVTLGHVIVSLRPLLIAFVLPPASASQATAGVATRLVFSSRERPEQTLGYVEVRPETTRVADGETLQVFRVTHHSNACMRWWAAATYAWSHAWAERRHVPTFPMARRDRWAFEVLYICPRPVVLVSVAHETATNMFPMDLIGSLGRGHFVLALRSTSPSIRLMKASGRIAIADVPIEHAATAIGLGDRHTKAHIDWDKLPFDTDRTPRYGLRVPRYALRIRELAVRSAGETGSHTLFVTDVVHDERRRSGLQMFTVSGPYYRYLRLRGIALPVVPVAPAD